MLRELKLELELSKQRIEKLDKEKEKELERLDFLNKELDRLYNKLKEFNDRDQQIYIEKKIYKWSNDKISAHHYALTRQQIHNIVSKIEESFGKTI